MALAQRTEIVSHRMSQTCHEELEKKLGFFLGFFSSLRLQVTSLFAGSGFPKPHCTSYLDRNSVPRDDHPFTPNHCLFIEYFVSCGHKINRDTADAMRYKRYKFTLSIPSTSQSL